MLLSQTLSYSRRGSGLFLIRKLDLIMEGFKGKVSYQEHFVFMADFSFPQYEAVFHIEHRLSSSAEFVVLF